MSTSYMYRCDVYLYKRVRDTSCSYVNVNTRSNVRSVSKIIRMVYIESRSLYFRCLNKGAISV